MLEWPAAQASPTAKAAPVKSVSVMVPYCVDVTLDGLVHENAAGAQQT